MAQWPAQRLGDLSGCGQVSERLVEKGLCVCKRELLGLAQELFPRGGVERRPQAGLILFGEGYGAGVEFGTNSFLSCAAMTRVGAGATAGVAAAAVVVLARAARSRVRNGSTTAASCSKAGFVASAAARSRSSFSTAAAAVCTGPAPTPPATPVR